MQFQPVARDGRKTVRCSGLLFHIFSLRCGATFYQLDFDLCLWPGKPGLAFGRRFSWDRSVSNRLHATRVHLKWQQCSKEYFKFIFIPHRKVNTNHLMHDSILSFCIFVLTFLSTYCSISNVRKIFNHTHRMCSFQGLDFAGAQFLCRYVSSPIFWSLFMPEASLCRWKNIHSVSLRFRNCS